MGAAPRLKVLVTGLSSGETFGIFCEKVALVQDISDYFSSLSIVPSELRFFISFF
jgi:hypothetical protein